MIKTLLLIILATLHLYSHQSSLALLELNVQDEHITGSYRLAIKDAHVLVDLDSNFDNRITWKEVVDNEQQLKRLVYSNLSINTKDTLCILKIDKLLLDNLNSNRYLYFPLDFNCNHKMEELSMNYSLLFNKDADHKAYMSVNYNKKSMNGLFSENKLSQTLILSQESVWESFIEFVKEGIIHIFIGIDHILFLLALLLPSVLILRNKSWIPNNSLKETLLNVFKIVTAFTLAHSITLTLSILGFISLESWIIESFIAFSVILAGLNNLTGTVSKRLWILVFVFGLIHGMGFASVLNELHLENSSKLITLFGFNLGVELGQAVIVGVIVPFIFLIRKFSFYKPLVLKLGSILIIAMGMIWLYERLFSQLLLLALGT